MDVKVYGYRTKGLYEWGNGYISPTKCHAWQKFWNDIADTKKLLGEELYFWRVMKPDNDFGCHILVTTGGSIYLHPMDGEGVIKKLNYAASDAVFRELQCMLKACAKAIGCSVDSYSREGVVGYER